MTDLALDAPEAPSTVLDAEPLGGPSGGGAPKIPAEEPSLRDTVATAMKEDAPKAEDGEDKPEKAAEKPEDAKTPPDPKTDKKPAERAPDGKFAAKQAEGDEQANAVEQPKPEARNGQGHIEPPAKLLPDAREKWVNTPRAVQRDVENMAREHEAEVTRYKEAADRYEPIRQFDEMARQSGRAGAHESLAEVVQLENLMRQNPLAAINQVLLRAGPRKPDGSPVSLREFAQVVSQMDDQAYNQTISRQPQQQPAQNDNPRIGQLERQIAEMQERQVATDIIAPFRAANPRYDELKGDIAFFLKSDKIPRSLSPQDRLAAAYDMAVRINPASHAPAPNPADPDPGDRAVDDLSGSKSIKSAPGAVSPDLEPDRGGSIRDIIRDNLRRSKVS